jgi:hypothetical protein
MRSVLLALCTQILFVTAALAQAPVPYQTGPADNAHQPKAGLWAFDTNYYCKRHDHVLYVSGAKNEFALLVNGSALSFRVDEEIYPANGANSANQPEHTAFYRVLTGTAADGTEAWLEEYSGQMTNSDHYFLWTKTSTGWKFYDDCSE